MRALAVGNQLLHGVDVFFGDDGLVVVHEVAIVRGQRIGVQGIAGRASSHDDGVVGLLHGLGSLIAQLVQRAALDKASELVLREAEQIGTNRDVGQHGVGSSGLGNSNDLRVEGDAVGVGLVEVIDLLLGQINSSLTDPDLDVVGSALCLFVFRLFAGSKGENHSGNKKQCKEFLEIHFYTSCFCSARSAEILSCNYGCDATIITVILLLCFSVVYNKFENSFKIYLFPVHFFGETAGKVRKWPRKNSLTEVSY